MGRGVLCCRLCSQARRLAGFRCRLLCYDLIDLPVGRDLELDAEAVDLETLLRESSFCMPRDRSLTENTSDACAGVLRERVLMRT